MNTKLMTLDDFFEIEEDYQNTQEMLREKYCNWVFSKSDNKYSPAIDVSIIKNVTPGIYKIEGNDIYLQSIKSDGLYEFPNSEGENILKDVEKFWQRADSFKEFNLMHKRGILLEGPPGTGKSSIITLLCKQLIEKYNGVVFLINNVSEFVKIYDYLKSIFRRIQPNTFVITIIEDIDKIATDSILPELLDFFDGKASINNHLIITTSNDTSDLPDPLLRVSRIDRKYYVGCANSEVRKIFFSNKGVNKEDLDKFVSESEGLTLSELKELFIGTYVMGDSFEETLNFIKNPYEKKEHSLNNINNKQIEIN